MHSVIAAALNTQPDIEAHTAALDDPEHGFFGEVLERTDVLTWWGHVAHRDVRDDIVDKIHRRVLCGMGIIVLHSGHLSKIFRRLMGTNCSLRWREIGEKERLWVVEPGHPIAQGIGPYIELPHSEMYGERFDVPRRTSLFSSPGSPGATCSGGAAPGAEATAGSSTSAPATKPYPIYHDREIQRILVNAVRWAKPAVDLDTQNCIKSAALEDVCAEA